MKPWLALMGASLVLVSASAAEAPTWIEPGTRPPVPVFDPTAVLAPAMVKRIAEPLVQVRERDYIDVLAVVLPEIGEAPPEHVARQFAGAWCDEGAHCVVLHVPGRKESPWIVPGGRILQVMNRDFMEPRLLAAMARARRESEDGGKVRAATTEAGDLMRLWTGAAIYQSEVTRTERTRRLIEAEESQLRRKLRLLVLGTSFVLCALGGVTILLSVRIRRGRRFPDLQWQPRLGAPHAGGNRALATLGDPS
jgi:hypothetical protein